MFRNRILLMEISLLSNLQILRNPMLLRWQSKKLLKQDAELVMATDPDADRLGLPLKIKKENSFFLTETRQELFLYGISFHSSMKEKNTKAMNILSRPLLQPICLKGLLKDIMLSISMFLQDLNFLQNSSGKMKERKNIWRRRRELWFPSGRLCKG